MAISPLSDVVCELTVRLVLPPKSVAVPSDRNPDRVRFVASVGGPVRIVSIGGVDHPGRPSLDWVMCQLWGPDAADPGLVWLGSLGSGQLVRLLGDLSPAPRYLKGEGGAEGRNSAQWQLTIQEGERLVTAAGNGSARASLFR